MHATGHESIEFSPSQYQGALLILQFNVTLGSDQYRSHKHGDLLFLENSSFSIRSNVRYHAHYESL